LVRFKKLFLLTTQDVVVDDLINLHSHANQQGLKLSLNDFLVRATALAVRSVPDINVAWINDQVKGNVSIDISVATSTKDGVQFAISTKADKKGLGLITEDLKVTNFNVLHCNHGD
jgi:pyruvate dehydrogenase E2 component (dihydrolipoamide acetyltransferase)